MGERDEKPKMERDWYTTTEVAQELGLAPASVRNAVKRGALKAQVVHGRLNVIAAEELERYKAEHYNRKGWDKRKDPAHAPSKGAEYRRQYRARRKVEQDESHPADA